MLMYRKNRYLDELGIPRRLYCGNFVREKKLYRLLQRYRYGFDYRDTFNMDVSFAEWLYSHMRMYKDNSVHDDTIHNIVFEEDEYTVEESVDWIIEISFDSIGFRFDRKITDSEIDVLINECKKLYADANCKGGYEEMRKIIKEKSELYIWWD